MHPNDLGRYLTDGHHGEGSGFESPYLAHVPEVGRVLDEVLLGLRISLAELEERRIGCDDGGHLRILGDELIAPLVEDPLCVLLAARVGLRGIASDSRSLGDSITGPVLLIGNDRLPLPAILLYGALAELPQDEPLSLSLRAPLVPDGCRIRFPADNRSTIGFRADYDVLAGQGLILHNSVLSCSRVFIPSELARNA